MREALLQMTLNEIYLGYVNNFLTLEEMAEHYEVSTQYMTVLYESAKELRTEVYG